jgi:hypothetical protein
MNGHVTRIENVNATGFGWEFQKEKHHYEDIDLNGMIMLKWMGCYGLDLPGSGQKQMEGPFEHGNEPLGSIKCWEVLE